MRLRRSRKIWRVHERHHFEATSQFQAAEREQTEPTKPHRCAEPGFYRRYSAREIRSSRYKKGSRPASAHAQCQEHGQLRALPPGVSSRWKGGGIFLPVPRMCSNWAAMLSKAHPTRQAKVCCAATVAKAIKLRASRYSTSPWPRTSPLSSREKRIFSAVGDAGLLFGPFRSSGAETSSLFWCAA